MSLISTYIDPSKVLDRNAVASTRIPIDDYPIFTKVDPLLILESYINDCLASGITHVAYSYDELPECPPDFLPLRRKMKSRKMGDGPFGTVKSLAKVAKTSEVMKKSLGTIPKTEVEGFETAKHVEESFAHKQPSGKYPIVETYFSSNHIVNSTSSSFTPLQHIPIPQNPFGTIFTSKQKQPSTSKPSKTLQPYEHNKSSEITLFE